jgi:hypothetical protein
MPHYEIFAEAFPSTLTGKVPALLAAQDGVAALKPRPGAMA